MSKGSTNTSVRVALAGNPNAGKTSVFNALTGSRQHVGNYPGVTVEQRWGDYTFDGTKIDVVDLPGTYSLTSFSPEEKVARDELIGGKHDVVVVVADSTALRRSLMLLAQVMQLGKTPVLCLNMADEAKASGQIIKRKELEAKLGFPVVEMTAHKGIGKNELSQAILRAARQNTEIRCPSLGEEIDAALEEIHQGLTLSAELEPAHAWVATRLLVGDEQIADELREQGANANAMEIVEKQRDKLNSESDKDIALRVTESYFAFVDDLLSDVIVTHARPDARATSEKIDAVLVNRAVGLPIFAFIMFGIFWVTFTLGETPMGWIEDGFGLLATW
ncbi:MAG: ferrous iron transporter B, partial [Kofleriaceae bacterium]|nr:ferrous iron transporter B [Kofleriaceae bacterium]